MRVGEPHAERIRDHLGVAGLWHERARRVFDTTPCLEDRGRAIVELHQQLPAGQDRVLRLLAAGSLAGLWGPAWLWDGAHQRRISLLSRATRARRAPPARPHEFVLPPSPGPSLR